MSRNIKNKKVFVGLSGGVDSSVAGMLLKKEGYDVVGVFLRCFNVDGCAERDAEDARRVAEKLEIPFYVWNFEKEYKEKVVEYMVEGYRQGLTPNPDVECNREIKFGLFLNRALSMGADYIATGHYVSKKGNMLSIAKDKNKDQSYFLWAVPAKYLKYCLFPIGNFEKKEVREMAKQGGLPTAQKKDSQGICFLGKVSLAEFLGEYIESKPGKVLSTSGDVLGEHSGAYFYTIGQRRGIGNLKHQKGVTEHRPLYVADKDIDTNTVVVADKSSEKALLKSEIFIENVNLFVKETIGIEISVKARVRYRQPLFKARISYEDGVFRMIFDEAQKYVAPGQSVVWYNKNGLMLGGGVITEAF